MAGPAGDTVDASSLDRASWLKWYARAAAAFAIAIVTIASGHAEVRVRGDVAAVHVEATQSNLGEVFSALESAFRLRVNTSMGLDRTVSGTFTGSLAQVLSHMLQGYNYFIRRQEAGLEVIFISLQADRDAAVARPNLRTNLAISLSEAVRRKSR